MAFRSIDMLFQYDLGKISQKGKYLLHYVS